MLNHEKLSKELAQATYSYFSEYAYEKKQARRLWEAACHDERLIELISMQEWPFLVPSWHSLEQCSLSSHIKINPDCGDYSVFSVDGSQIYPDRHQGMSCYLINIGVAFLNYGPKSWASFSSEPFFMAETEFSSETFDENWVNCQRTEFEFKTGLDIALQYVNDKKKPLFLCDGSLIFWHLESKDQGLRDYFFKKYSFLFQELYEHRIVHAGYISLPKSRELANIVRVISELPEYNSLAEKYRGKYIVDSDVVDFFMKPFCRTIIFENRSPLVKFYASEVKPCFFYLHNGVEVVRIELPAWIAQESAWVDRVASIILSQSLKGNGYPVCLAEAHEQAVVTTADREIFYAMLQKSMFKHDMQYSVSQKSEHKRSLAI